MENLAPHPTRNQYQPDHVSPPGESLLERIEELGITPAELAQRTGLAPLAIDEILAGEAPVTPEVARQLEAVLGMPANYWIRRQEQYLEHQGCD